MLYSAAQHAREWITPEMNRRLLHYVIDGYASDPTIKRLLDKTELWFVPVANPDGYDFTFTPGNRLWRKNLRDNDGDGQITGQDGVDPNRNYPTKWGYDNEGSSPSYGSQTYRGVAPASEPETRALDGLMSRIGFAFQINYHSAAELLLYGVGWQVSTPSPDDQIFEAQAGDDADPAVPGYDPDQSAELYTTNGETTEHAHDRYGTLAYTPEMSTCETASEVDPDDAFEPGTARASSTSPTQRRWSRASSRRTSRSRSPSPSRRTTRATRSPPSVWRHPTSTSTLRGLLRRPADGGRHRATRAAQPGACATRSTAARTHVTDTRLWQGGERYGDEGTTYYGEYRGVVTGARPGDRVRVWFTGVKPGAGPRESEAFTYRVAEDSGNTVIVIADEDYDGVNPTYDPPRSARPTPRPTSTLCEPPASTPRSGTSRRRACRTTSAC